MNSIGKNEICHTPERRFEHEHEHEQCGCGHCHEHAGGSEKALIIRLVIGAAMFAAGIISGHYPNGNLAAAVLYVTAYIILGYDIVMRAAKNIVKGHVFDENFLMSIASIGAFLVGEQPEAVGVMLFYQIGEMLQDKATQKSRRSITALMDIRPDYANIEKDGVLVSVSPESVSIGDIIVVKPGEKIPLDGIVSSGGSFLDTSALTGESVPRRVTAGDTVMSGSINTDSPIYIEVTKEFTDSTVAKILEMVENAQSKKAKSERFITAFAKYYTPIVVALAVLVMLIPSLTLGDFRTWIYRGLTFLVASCPCALVVSIPLAFFAGIGCSSRNGILVKGGSCIEALSRLGTVVFDKTGTLTKGVFTVSSVYAQIPESDLIRYAAYAEFYSNHPIASSIKEKYGEIIDTAVIADYREIAGMGISALIDGKETLAGNERLMSENEIPYASADNKSGSVVYVAVDKSFAGYIVISDEIKKDSVTAVKSLMHMGIKPVMLTGDSDAAARHIAEKTGIERVYSQLLPQDKVIRLEEILAENRGAKTTAFVGDGINDAPSLMRADLGIAMGGIGSDSAIEAADVVLMTDEPSRIADGVKISAHTMKIIYQNIIFSIGVKVIVMLLSVSGISNMWPAIFADVGVALIAILNALRALGYKIKK